MGSTTKRELTLKRDGLPAILRELADGLETGTTNLGGAPLDLADFAKMKIGIKQDEASGTVTVTLRLKPRKQVPVCVCEAPPCTCGAAEALAATKKETGYKPLKKRLGKAWSGVKNALALGGLPQPAVLKNFAEDFKAMLTFPDKGESEYPANAAALDELLAAAEAGDHDRASAAAARIESLKKACHKLYK